MKRLILLPTLLLSTQALANSFFPQLASHEVCGNYLNIFQVPFQTAENEYSSVWYATGSKIDQEGGIQVSHSFPLTRSEVPWSYRTNTQTWHAQVRLTGATRPDSRDELWVKCQDLGKQCYYELFNFDSGVQKEVDVNCRTQVSPKIDLQSFEMIFNGQEKGKTELFSASFMGSEPISVFNRSRIRLEDTKTKTHLEFDNADIRSLGEFFAGDMQIYRRMEQQAPYTHRVSLLGKFRLAAISQNGSYVGKIYNLKTGSPYLDIVIQKK